MGSRGRGQRKGSLLLVHVRDHQGYHHFVWKVMTNGYLTYLFAIALVHSQPRYLPSANIAHINEI